MRLCARFKIRQDQLKAQLYGPNASGVPPTSIFNSITTGVARVFAVIYAVFGIRFDDQSIPYYVSLVRRSVYMAVAGDDGLLILPEYIGSRRVIIDSEFLIRYSLAFSWAGYDVGPKKIRVHSSEHWRLSTFLAMRPYWSGHNYEYGVEISRRLKTMFWLYDKCLHPIAWARGVAVSLLKASRHVPVVRDICLWYLSNTAQITTEIETASFTNNFSTVYGYEVVGDLTERTILEFCADYSVPRSLYDDFLSYLKAQQCVLVNLDHPLLAAIAARE
jgi:hypothetical protein